MASRTDREDSLWDSWESRRRQNAIVPDRGCAQTRVIYCEVVFRWSGWMLRGLIGFSLFVMACAGHAQSYPSKPVRIVVAFAPGGADDFHGRLMAQKLGELV